MQELHRGAIVIPAARLRLRSADSEYPFRQNSDFHYLTAFPEPDALCVLLPEREEKRFVLFVRPKNREAEIWSGRRAGVEKAREVYGADEAYPLDELESRLPELLKDVDVLHYAWGCDETLDHLLLRIVAEQRRSRARRGHGIMQLHDPGATLHEMRLIKDDFELQHMRAAVAATVAGHLHVLGNTRPGMHESDLEAAIEFTFRRHGASGPAYGTIVGSGDNATILHYRENNAPLQEGQLVLIDAGAEVDLYAADITRTFPVGSRFTPAQRDLYGLVLEAQEQAIATVRPGASFEAPHDKAVEVLCQGLVDLGLLEGPAERVRESSDYRKFYMHRTSHWLGLDVHDVGLYTHAGEARRFEPGMILTVEPGLYCAADLENVPPEFLGTGVRIEDDVLVTPDGHEVLTARVPKDIGAIEALRATALDDRATRDS
jgi:Xaa-Pro aminopeptidase